MSRVPEQASTPAGPGPVPKREPSAAVVLGALIVAVVVAGLAIVVLLQALFVHLDEEQRPARFAAQTKALRELQAAQRRELMGHPGPGGTKGAGAIPIDRAMELVVEELSARRPREGGGGQ